MKTLPRADMTLLVRTDFADASAWQAICQEIQEPPAEFQEAFAAFAAMNAAIGQDMGTPQANVTTVDDPDFADLTPEQLIERMPADSEFSFLFVVDKESVSRPDHPILVVDLYHERGRTFRTVPSQLQMIECNLSIANCDWEDFADRVDSDGVYRGGV